MNSPIFHEVSGRYRLYVSVRLEIVIVPDILTSSEHLQVSAFQGTPERARVRLAMIIKPPWLSHFRVRIRG